MLHPNPRCNIPNTMDTIPNIEKPSLITKSIHKSSKISSRRPNVLGAKLSGAQLSALKKWQIGPRTVGPRGPIVRGPICHRQMGPGQPGPGFQLSGAQLSGAQLSGAQFAWNHQWIHWTPSFYYRTHLLVGSRGKQPFSQFFDYLTFAASLTIPNQ